LTQLFFYACYHAGELLAGGDDLHRMAGGVEMLRALHGLLTMLKIAFLMLAIRRSTNSLPLATTGAILYVVLAHGYSRIERPQVVGEVLFALLLWTISGRQLAWWCVAGIPAFFVVWANCHGSFLVGFVLLGAMCAGQIVASIWAPRPIDRAKWWRNCWIRFGIPSLVLAPVAIGILNPHGWELYPGILELSRHPNIRTVAEWAPLDFSKPVGGHWLYLGTLALVTLSQAVSPRPLGLSRALVLLAFGIGPLHQQRMGIWWMLIFPWVLMDLWHGAAAVMPRFWRGFRSVPSFRKTLIAVLVVLMGASWSGAVQLLFGKDPRPLANAVTRSTLWPLAQHLRTGAGLPELGAALKKYPNQRFQGRIFAQDMLADYLVWALPEKAPIQIYNHAHVFPEAVWHDHITVLEGKKTCKSVLDRYQVNLIAIDPIVCTELAQVIRESGDWQIIKDEGQGEGQDRIPDVFNGKLFVALRKQPI
jgi:hypothetical protein